MSNLDGITAEQLNKLAARVHKANERWWLDLETGERLERNKPEMCMLMVSELSEAMEGLRKGLPDDHLPEFPSEVIEIADCMIRLFDYVGGHGWTFVAMEGIGLPAIENAAAAELLRMTYAICRLAYDWQLLERRGEALRASMLMKMLLRYADWRGFDVWPVFEAKMAYNATRADHTREARLAAGGKKF